MVVQVRVNVTSAVEGLTALVNGIRAGVGEGLKQAAEDGFNDSQRLVPVRTGRLKASGGIKETTPQKVTYGYDAPYAGFVEFGTGRRIAKPYVTPRYNVLGNGLAAEYVYRRLITSL